MFQIDNYGPVHQGANLCAAADKNQVTIHFNVLKLEYTVQVSKLTDDVQVDEPEERRLSLPGGDLALVEAAVADVHPRQPQREPLCAGHVEGGKALVGDVGQVVEREQHRDGESVAEPRDLQWMEGRIRRGEDRERQISGRNRGREVVSEAGKCLLIPGQIPAAYSPRASKLSPVSQCDCGGRGIQA